MPRKQSAKREASRKTSKSVPRPTMPGKGSADLPDDLKDKYIASLEEQVAALKLNNELLQRALSDRDVYLDGVKGIFELTAPPPGVPERRAGRIEVEKILARLKNGPERK
jgi:hypothetical protein